MSFPYTPNLQDAKYESLQTQFDFLNLLRLRHMNWMSAADDLRVRHRHQEIVDLIDQITDRYSELLRERH